MDTTKPFTIPINVLTNFTSDLAVEFFRRLLWAEAARVGIGRHLIDVPNCINVGDGGIDAFIENAMPSIDELIPCGTSGFQIKSSDLSPLNCKKELHKKGKIDESIKPEVKKLLDEDGTYILVLFADITTQNKNIRENTIREELIRLGYESPKIRVYSANQMASFGERFPSLVAYLRSDFSQCLPYSSWAGRRDITTPKNFILDDGREQIIEDIRGTLRNPGESCPVFRITGLPGIGKTRLIFEALSPDDLKNRVIYVTADQFQVELRSLLQNDNNLSAIVVIDECNINQHDSFVRSFSGRGPRLAIFTLSYETGKVPQPSTCFNLEPFNREKIEEIIKAEAPSLAGSVAYRLSEFADGYPFIAVLLTQSYLTTKDASAEDFLSVDDDGLMNRLIGGEMDVNSDHFHKTKRALKGLSLFQKVGHKGESSGEAKWLAEHFGITKNEFEEIISEQKQRGIIKGDYYIYIRPFMLRIHLLKEWWGSRGLTIGSFNEFSESIPKEYRNDLLQRFFDNIPYIAITEEGRKFAKDILGRDGLFSDGVALEIAIGADFFLKLAEADPESALECLKRTIGTWDKDRLLRFRIGRRQIVWALERMAIWRRLFSDAARLLLALGEAENETWSNNASGVFASLFSPAQGQLAPTEASPQERFPILKQSLESDSRERRLLALRACDQALQTEHFSRIAGIEHQGLRIAPGLWMPKTWGELFDVYRQVWNLLYENLDNLPEDEQQEAVDIMIRHIRGLGRIGDLADMVIDTVSELSKKQYADKRKILIYVYHVLQFEGKNFSAEMRERWERLRDNITGYDFSSQLKRYIGMSFWDTYDVRKDMVKREEQLQKTAHELAQKAFENKALLLSELDWLMTDEAREGQRFGYELGKIDDEFSLLPELLSAQRSQRQNASISFLGGYFKALFEKDSEKWEKQLDDITKDNELRIWLPEITWQSGTTDCASLRILRLARDGMIDLIKLNFSIIRGGLDISENVFEKWMHFLLGNADEQYIYIALDWYNLYYIRKFTNHPERNLPEKLTLELLTHELLFKESESYKPNGMDEYHWSEIAEEFIELYPQHSLTIAEMILENFDGGGNIFGRHSQTIKLLNEISKQNPEEVWKIITKYIGPPIDKKAFEITWWLRGTGNDPFFNEEDRGMLGVFPIDSILKWVDEDIENRAWYFAYFAPKVFFREEGNICFTRELLVLYGSREDVKEELMANFSTGFFTGSMSINLQERKQELLNFKQEEDNENVKQWIDEYVNSLDKEIERAKIEEERRGF